MSKTVVTIYSADDAAMFTVSGPSHALPGKLKRLPAQPSDEVFKKLAECPKPMLVRDAGSTLFKALGTHDIFTDSMRQLPEPGEECAIYLQVEAAHPAENLPWEALWDDSLRFLALDPDGRWPIARFTWPRTPRDEVSRVISPNLRITVVLGAAREDALPEWESLWAVLEPLQLPVHLQLIVSQQTVHDAVKALIDTQATGAHSVSVEFAGDLKYLLERIESFSPNILHFFCHGSASSAPALELENRMDRIKGATRGSIQAETRDLARLSRMNSLLLVTLNCCHGATTAARESSIARQLAEEGVPAAVAMREAIAPSDAFTFTRSFYGALIEQLEPAFAAVPIALAGGGQAIPLSETVWAQAMRAARKDLLSVHTDGQPPEVAATACHQWTFPVIYLEQAAVKLLPRAAAVQLTAAERQKLNTMLKQFRDTREAFVANRAPQATIDALDAEITKLEDQLD